MSRGQLAGLGLTPAMVRSRLGRGSLVRLHRGVYAVGHTKLRPDGVALAAVLAAGPGAVLSHRDAAGLHCIRPANHRLTDVTVDGQRRPLDGVRLHRAKLTPADVTEIDGLPVTTLPRTLVDLAGVLAREHLAKALSEAERVHHVDVAEIAAAMERTRGRSGRGHAALSAALDEIATHGAGVTRVELELRFAALVRDHALPRPRTNVHVHGREVDAWWAEARLAVELDSWEWHRTRRAFQNDREKGNALAARGITLLRFTWRDVTVRGGEVARQLAPLLRQGEPTPGWLAMPQPSSRAGRSPSLRMR